MIGSDLLSESNKLCKHSDLDATRRLEELQSEFAEAPPIFISNIRWKKIFSNKYKKRKMTYTYSTKYFIYSFILFYYLFIHFCPLYQHL